MAWMMARHQHHSCCVEQEMTHAMIRRQWAPGMCRSGLHKGLVSSLATLHVGPDQSDPRPNPSPNSSPIPMWGSRSGGEVTRAERPSSTDKTRVLHKVLCRPLLHISRAVVKGCTYIFPRLFSLEKLNTQNLTLTLMRFRTAVLNGLRGADDCASR